MTYRFDVDLARRRWLQAGLLGAIAPALAACGAASTTDESAPTRTWKMGFSPTPARPDATSVVNGIDVWSRRAELAIIHEETPWAKLLAGTSPDQILVDDKVELVKYLRAKGLQLVFMGDLNDGLAREAEAPQLRAANRSITEPAVQALYRDYLLAVARRLAPEFIGLAAETNLVRAAAPATLYAAVKKTANDTAAALRAAGVTVPLMSSVQVETAWGRLGGSGPFVGIATDLRDFPFTQVLGLSSYPYFGYATPEEIPDDHYSRVLQGSGLPAMVVEGGWTSAAAGTVASTPALQARYIRRHAALLDSIQAQALLQLVFADIVLSSIPPPVPANLPLFTNLGLVDSDLVAKPALAEWDSLFARRHVAG